MARAICVLSAVTLGTLVPVAAAIGDKLVRDPGSNGLTIAVVLTLGTALSALVSVLVLLPLSVFHKPATIWRVLGLTLLRHVAGNWHASDRGQPASASDVRQPPLVDPKRLIVDPDKAAGRGRLGDAY